MNKKSFKIRKATINDASDISELSRQLGYPASESDIEERLKTILNSNDHIVYVAFVPDGKTIAWIHIYKAQRIESGAFAEIGGFIVSEAFRSKGLRDAPKIISFGLRAPKIISFYFIWTQKTAPHSSTVRFQY